MDVLSCGESDAGDTLNRRNNNTLNSISSTLTSTLRDGDTVRRRGRDITYFIAEELLMTERTYKRNIELVTVTWSNLISSLTYLGNEPVSSLARVCLALEPLALSSGAFLATMEKVHAHSNDDEPEYKRIADILYDYLSSTFDAYMRYISRSGSLVGLVESVRRVSDSAVERLAREFDSTAPQSLTCLLLAPLHRAVCLHGLVSELSQALCSKSAMNSLHLSAELSSSALEQLSHVENHAALCQLQREIVGYDKLLVADREFLRLGCLYKHSSKGLQQRMLFLFSDVLIITSKCGSSQFRAHSALALKCIEIKPSELPHSFILTGEDTNVTLSACNDTEYLGWSQAISGAIERAVELNLEVDTELTPNDPDTGVSSTAAGTVASLSAGSLSHVCWHRVTSLSMERLHLAMRTQLSGCLLRKFKNSIGWQKLWVVFASFTLFFYKSWQDDKPLASLPLLGYSVGPPSESDDIHKDFVFKLQFKNHVYFFRANSQFTYNRWTEVLRSTMVNHT